ncbi:hypothetical protein EXN66_Car000160 [Channa argus]|uniref:Secreted protein n=1 Tax=Channa argus TaxID=215402 RepID=A0A6G1QXP4_CHAAH|nr:hypothetical protein EXN66_Car000160 [Channa argus]
MLLLMLFLSDFITVSAGTYNSFAKCVLFSTSCWLLSLCTEDLVGDYRPRMHAGAGRADTDPMVGNKSVCLKHCLFKQ